MENLRFPNRKTSMEKNIQTIEPAATNEPFKMTQETAESLKTLIDAVAPYVERHMEASRSAMLQDRGMTLQAATQERNTTIQAAAQEREAVMSASDIASKRTFHLLAFIVGTSATMAMVFAYFGQWAIAEKIAIGMLSFSMGARVVGK